MYLPEAFAETRRDVLVETIQSIQFGMLITATDDDLHVSHVPFAVRVADNGTGSDDDNADPVVLETHLARANPHWKAIDGARRTMAVFQGPQAYVRPGFYPSKAEHGKVVPTWAYIVIHARGAAELIATPDELRAHLHDLTDASERNRPVPWSVDDAPPAFVDALQRGIVGVRLRATTLEGKWKINQNKSDADRRGTANGLSSSGPDGRALAEALATRSAQAAVIGR